MHLSRPLLLIRTLAWVAALALVSASGPTARAVETDNFYLPLDNDLADVGDFLTTQHTTALENAVSELNGMIQRASASKGGRLDEAAARRCYSPGSVAQCVAKQFGLRFVERLRTESAIRATQSRTAHGSQAMTSVFDSMNFRARSPFDPRVIGVLFQSPTIKAYGVYFGTDKFAHFHRVGLEYFDRFCSRLASGDNRQAAYREVLSHFGDHAVFAERNMFGSRISGIYSNADMAVNQLGFKFFENLTASTVLKGREQPPLLVRRGALWSLNSHVRPQTGWFRVYLSDHWNEALNPSLYAPSMQPRIRKVLADRAEHIIQFYTRKDGRPNSARYFEDLARKLSTYYGENYGHAGRQDELMNIGNTCYPALSNANQVARQTSGRR